MSADLVGYGLVLLAVLAVALVLTLVLLVPISVVTRLRRRHVHKTTPAVVRRCRSCGLRWKGHPGEDPPVWLTRLRRRARRKARQADRAEPAWARPRGYTRCPSCLSPRIRDSRVQTPGDAVSTSSAAG